MLLQDKCISYELFDDNDTSTSWYDAQRLCKLQGGDLAMAKTIHQIDTIQYFINYTSNSRCSYIGLQMKPIILTKDIFYRYWLALLCWLRVHECACELTCACVCVCVYKCVYVCVYIYHVCIIMMMMIIIIINQRIIGSVSQQDKRLWRHHLLTAFV